MFQLIDGAGAGKDESVGRFGKWWWMPVKVSSSLFSFLIQVGGPEGIEGLDVAH